MPYFIITDSPASGNVTTPGGQSLTASYSSVDQDYEINQSYPTKSAMDAVFAPGTYVFTLSGQPSVDLTLAPDMYPPVPQIVNGTWDMTSRLIIDPSSNAVLNLEPFPGFATVGQGGEVGVVITAPNGTTAFSMDWTAKTTSTAPTAVTIPAGTLNPGTDYTATLYYYTYPTVSQSATTAYISETLAILYAQAASGGTPPTALQQPTSDTIAIGGSGSFTFIASGSPSYQWYLNGEFIPGSTDSILGFFGVDSSYAGTYTCVATNGGGSVTSNPVTLSVVSTTDPGRLINISCRAQIGTGANILIAGFAVGGAGTSGTQSLLVRGSGPALVPFGVTGALADPQLQIFSNSSVLASNDGWAGDSMISAAAASVGAFPWTNTVSHDSALLQTVAPGAYTAQISGQSGDTGVGLAEIYDATPAGTYTAASPRLINLSARVQVGTGGNILIAGFVIGGSTSKAVLIRGSGPALVPFGVTGTLADPKLQLFSGSTLLASNVGWGGDLVISQIASTVGAFPWMDSSSADSAIVATLPPGSYTAQISGASNDTGVALVEVYELP